MSNAILVGVIINLVGELMIISNINGSKVSKNYYINYKFCLR